MSSPELSPAAQTVLEATAWAVYRAPAASCPDLRRLVAPKIAAALRAAADTVEHHWDGAECVDHLQAIAAQLEGQP